MGQSRTIQSFDEVKVWSTSSEAHTNVRFLSCDGHQLYERGVDLEVEGVRYIEMHRAPAARTYWARLLQGEKISN